MNNWSLWEDNKEEGAKVRDLDTKLSKPQKGAHVLIKEHDDVTYEKTSIIHGLHATIMEPKETKWEKQLSFTISKLIPYFLALNDFLVTNFATSVNQKIGNFFLSKM